eukprot:GHVR01029409.1.p1 GENE.GHVR01029409.1~~GHVR01029409.1.p1  ORF type:complete len:633 (-),score=107.39 GHVR01029409.1:519-2417(-)
MTDNIENLKVFDFNADVSKVLQLMAKSLYTNKDIFLRELISNASDACNKLKYDAIKDPGLLAEDIDLKITVKIDKKKNAIIVSDNGIGMDDKDLIANLGTIANSGTQKFLDNLKDEKNGIKDLIGQFGVGFYSVFMVSDLVTVYSTKAGSKKTFVWGSDGLGKYTLNLHDKQLPRGTIVELDIKKENADILEDYNIERIIKLYSDHVSFPIKLIKDDNKESVINKSSAIWSLSKSEVTEEQNIEFYRYISHSYDKPWLTIKNKIEGDIGYTSLLYIPASSIYNILYNDYKSKIKLYIKKVFISDEVSDIIPSYLRFLCGVIDAEDLPLNISRETLQSNLSIIKIKKSITNKVLAAIEKTQKQDDYKDFWKNFGAVLKEGLLGGSELDKKDQILELCRFYSTSEKDLRSLKDYVANMKEGQDKIYYFCGENIERLSNHSQLEGFKKHNIEVLLLTDRIDNFWIDGIGHYKEKKFQSITSANIDFASIKKKKNKDDAIEGEVVKEETDSKNEETVIEEFKKVLDNKVQDVVVSNKLVESPACLSESDNGVGMNKLLMQQQNSNPLKILEINMDHELVQEIKASIINKNETNTEENQRVKTLIDIIFYEACIIEGEKISDTKDFIKKINILLSKN